MGKIILILSMFFCLNLHAQTDTTASILILKNEHGKYEVTMRKGKDVELDLVSYILAHFLKLEYDSLKPKSSEF